MLKNVEKKIIENWKTDKNVFDSLKEGDLVGEGIVVYAAFENYVQTIQKIPGEIIGKDYFWRECGAVQEGKFHIPEVNPYLKKEYKDMNETIKEATK